MCNFDKVLYNLKGNLTQAMKTYILVLALLLVSTQSVTTGSCARYSLDGENCEQCVAHYHLFQGSCYVDILGCELYSFGNICESCENNYILVNNLCCDHNCMLKFMKRHQSSNVKKSIADNFEVLSKVIPYMNQKYAQQAGHTLIEIEVHQYLDVTRYVLIYEFHMGKYTMKRAVVDYTVKGGKIIVLDWSTITDRSQFLEFHKEEIPLENQAQIQPLLQAAFKNSHSIALANKVIFTELTQYEIVVNNEEKEKILYKTLYLWQGSVIHLISEEKSMPTFVPSEVTLEGSTQIAQYSSENPAFIKVVSFVQSDPRFKNSISRVAIMHKTRYMNEYQFFITFEQGKMKYFIVEDLKTQQLKIVMYDHQLKKVNNPIVDEVIEIMQNKKEEDEKTSEEAVLIHDLVDEAVKEIINEHKQDESESTCEGVDCQKRQQLQQTDQEVQEVEVVNFFRTRYPEISGFQVLKVWHNDNFKTFSEWAIKIKYNKNRKILYALEEKDTHEFTFWGQNNCESNKDCTVNVQAEDVESEFQLARQTILSEFPETQNMLFRRGIVRNFPDQRKREIVVLRGNSSRIKYVVLTNEDQTKYVKEWQVVKESLPELTPQVEEKEKLEQKIEVIIEEIIEGRPIDPEVNLSQEDPIEIQVIEQDVETPQSPVIKEDTEEEKIEKQIVRLTKESVENLGNFENIHQWKVLVDEQTQQRTVLIRDLVSYYYYYQVFTIDIPTSTVTFVKSYKTESVTINFEGNMVLPKIFQVSKPEHSDDEIINIVEEIIEEITQAEDTQIQTSESSDSLVIFVQQNNPDLSEARFIRKWQFSLQTYSQNTLLFEKEGNYWYVYVFYWKTDGSYTIEGIESVESPIKNAEGKRIQPIELKNSLANKKGEQIVSQVLPNLEGWRKVKSTFEAVYPDVTRYIITVRFETTKVRYVFHEKDGQLRYIEEKLLKQNLPSRGQKGEIIEEIVQGAFEEIIHEHKEDAQVVVQEEQSDDPSGQKQKRIVKFFRSIYPQVETVEVVKVWKNKSFKTFNEWAVNFKVGQKSIIFYALEDKQTKEFTFWGQEQKVSQQNPNPQQVVALEQVSYARELISQQFPETKDLPTKRSVLRVFPDGRERVKIIIRHDKSRVLYVVLKGADGKAFIKEWETVQTDLPTLNKQEKQKVELENKVQILVETLITGKPSKEAEEILVNTQNVEILIEETPQEETEFVVEESQIIKIKESHEFGKQIEHIKTVTHDDEETLNQITQFVATTEESPIEEREKQILAKEIPVSVISETFCNTQDFLLFYDLGDTVVSFGFRTSLTNQGQYKYLGKKEISKSASWPTKKIIKKLTKLNTQYDSSLIQQTISQNYPKFEGRSAYKIIANQLGQHSRFMVLYDEPGQNYIERFVISNSLASNEEYDIVEECRLQKIKTKQTTTKVTITGESSVETTEVETLLEQDEIANQVIDFIKKEEDVDDFETSKIKTTQYETTIEYVIELEKEVEDNADDLQDVVEIVTEVVIHDKNTHENQIVSIIHENKTRLEIEEEDEEEEDVYEVVTEQNKDKLPIKVSEAIDEMNKQIKEKNHEQYDISICYVEDDGEYDKVKEVIVNKDGTETIITTCVVNENTGEYTIEETKNIDEKVVEHLKPVEEKQGEEKPAVVILDVSEIDTIIKKVDEGLKQKAQNEEGQCCQENEEEKNQEQLEVEEVQKQVHTHTVTIDPKDIQDVIEQLFQNQVLEPNTQQQEEQAVVPSITITQDEAISYLRSIRPQTQNYAVVEVLTNQFPDSATATIELRYQNTDVNGVVTKDKHGISLVYYEQFITTGEQTVEEVVEYIEEEDIAGYKPIDPDNVYYVKALQILKTQPKRQFQKEIDLNDPSQVITEATLTVRTNYPIIKNSNVIRIIETFNTVNIKQYIFYFYIQSKGDSYSVYAITIEYNSQGAQPVYKVISVEEIIKDSKIVNNVLESGGQSVQPHINIAYGYEDINLAESSHDQALIDIQAEIDVKYASMIKGQTVIGIQKLELKNGKVNYVIKYDNVYFTVYYDQILMRIVLLNAVTSLNNNQYVPVSSPESNQFYKMALQHVIGQHSTDLKEYKVISSGQISNSTHHVFQIQLFSQGHKYRGVIAVHIESMDVSEISWNEIVEVDLKHINYMQLFVEEYQRISGSQLETNTYFNMVDTYAKNRNIILVNSQILGVAYKPQNLGFNYKIFYKLANSELVSVEVYIESFTEKIEQIALVYQDFTNNFVQIKPEGQEVKQISQVLANKAGISLNDGEYLIQSVEAKDFLFGSLYKMTLQLDGVSFQGLLYHDHTTEEANLLSWSPLRSKQSCEIWEVQDVKCQQCSQGYYLSVSEKLCYKETMGCERYMGDLETCSQCANDYTLTNHLCVKDCGGLCLPISLP